ncbi:hypothetical protein B0H14DRAFT_1397108 [Mycena olivaceomarginata]|nr:hypothetical protein B0H14DRAFT_1397108 [Mycena olivaceomarginata]
MLQRAWDAGLNSDPLLDSDDEISDCARRLDVLNRLIGRGHGRKGRCPAPSADGMYRNTGGGAPGGPPNSGFGISLPSTNAFQVSTSGSKEVLPYTGSIPSSSRSSEECQMSARDKVHSGTRFNATKTYPHFPELFPYHSSPTVSDDNMAADVGVHAGSNIPSESVGPTRPVRPVGTMAIVSAAVARRKDPANPGPFVCKHCRRDFTAKHNYKNHLNSHYSVRPFLCEKCGQDFGTSHVLRRHQGKCNAPI